MPTSDTAACRTDSEIRPAASLLALVVCGSLTHESAAGAALLCLIGSLPMDLCWWLIVLGVVLFVVTTVGHGIWVVLASIFRSMGARPEPWPEERAPRRSREGSRVRCPRCGVTYSHSHHLCPSCGLSPTAPLARDLRDLETTARNVEALVNAGTLEAGLGEQVYHALERRQELLLKGEDAAATVGQEADSSEAAASQEPTWPVWHRLDKLLSTCPDVRRLSLTGRRQALAWFRQLRERRLDRLSATSLLALARLVSLAGLTSRALEVYQALLAHYPEAREALTGAMEAGRLADREKRPEVARRFLRFALDLPLPLEEREEAERLLAAADQATAAAGMLSAHTMTGVEASQSSPAAVRESDHAEPILATPVAEALPSVPSLPQRTWGQMLAGFMEEKNILWGELVGGLLIVGCSIALVISLWRTLEEQIHYFPFLVFAGITAGLFSAGLYTLSHWKLEATSRGLLVIATLLTPLDFLVLAGLSPGREAGLIDWATELVALAGFTFLVQRSAHILVDSSLGDWSGRAPWLLTLAVIGASASQLLVPRLLDLAEPVAAFFLLLSLAPVVFQLVAVGPLMGGLGRREQVEPAQANTLLLFLGQTTFATLVALGFIVYWSDDPLRTVRYLAVPMALAGLPVLLSGALVRAKLADVPAVDEGRLQGLPPSILRLVGTAVGLTGLVVLLLALGLAWPRPVALIAIGLLNAAVFAGAGLIFRLPPAHIPATLCLAVAFLTAFHGVQGQLTAPETELGARLLELAASPANAVGLTLLAALLAIAAEGLARAQRRLEALYQVTAAGIAALIALVEVLPEGAAIPLRGAFVFGACGLGGLIVNARWRQPLLTFAGASVLIGFIAYLILGFESDLTASRLWLFIFLAHATAVGLVGLSLYYRGKRPAAESQQTGRFPWIVPVYALPLRETALVVSFLALVPLAATVGWDTLPICALASFWLAAIWIVFAWSMGSASLFACCQAALTLGVIFAVSAWLGDQEWVAHRAEYLLHLWSLQTYAVALALLGLIWSATRHGLRRFGAVGALLEPGWPTVDRGILVALIVGQVFLAAVGVWPDIVRETVTAAELSRFSGDLPSLDGGLAWMLLATLALVVVSALWETRPQLAVLGLVIVVLAIPVLIAHGFRDERAAGSALRWALAAAFVAGSALVWARTRLSRLVQPWGIIVTTGDHVAQQARLLLVSMTAAPVLLLTAWVAVRGFAGVPVPGPDAASFFAQLGWTVSMVVPLGLLVVGLAGHGVREDFAGYIFAAGLVLLVTVTGGYALGLVTAGATFGTAEAIFLVQLGIVSAALWALAWLGTGRWRNQALLSVQASLAVVGNVALFLPALLAIVADWGGPLPSFVQEVGDLLGWGGWLATMVAAVWVMQLSVPRQNIHILAATGLGLGILAACATATADPSGWRAYHVLTLAWSLLAMALLAASWIGAGVSGIGPLLWTPERRARAAVLLKQLFPSRPAQRWVEALGTVVVLLALGGAWGDPARPYWSSAATLAVAVLVGAMAVWVRRPAYVYASGLLLNVVAFLVWQAWLVDHWGLVAWFTLGPDIFDRFLLLQILALAIGSAVWSVVEWGLRRREPPLDLRGSAMPFAHAAAVLSVHLLAIMVLAGLGGDLFLLEIHLRGALVWIVLAATAGALMLCAWDPEAGAWGLPMAPLYLAGLVAVGLVLHQRSLTPRELGWWAAVSLSAFALVVSVLARLGQRGAGLARILRLPAQAERRLGGWFVPGQGTVAGLTLVLSLWICLDFASLNERLAGPMALGMFVFAGILLAGLRPERLGVTQVMLVHHAALVAAILTALEIGWALLDPDRPAPWLHRNAVLLAVLTVFAGLYGSGLAGFVPRAGNWAMSARQHGPLLGWLAGTVLAVVVVQEFLLYDPALRRTPLTLAEVVLVALLLAAVIVAAVWIAVSPRHDFSRLSDRGRTACVWSAELLFVILFVHLRLNVPDIFPRVGGRWPFVIMAISFIGVGLGELFRRRKLAVLAGPLHHTGLLLPLLPLLSFLVRPLAELGQIGELIPGLKPLWAYLERLPQGYGMHALLWFLLGMLYALVAVLRRASGFALLAALTVNFGLWVIYANQYDLAFTLHPQLWLIPVGGILLAAEYLNRDRLTPGQAAAARYLGLLLIYVSSTADMFITGLGESVVLPLLLALFSVGGVLAGILLRVRAFLFLGIAFLVLVVFAQIWHAAVDRHQTWLWWACGIVLGIAILALFALFEKRRNDVLRVIEDIKHWR
jgi:hypothetical protein